MNKELFKSIDSKNMVKSTDAVNNAGGTAYNLSDKATLAQLVCTGCFNGTYYVSDKDQLNNLLELSKKVDTEFLAKLAVYARQNALMKDSPAVLAALVTARDPQLLKSIFNRVIDNPKMFRNYIQTIRSGVCGRKSFGSLPKKLLQQWLENLSDEQLFKADIGNNPSLKDCIKMIRPKPGNKNRSALYAYLLDKKHNKEDLCALAQSYEVFKKDLTGEAPNVPFQMLTALPLTKAHWAQIAANATWTQTRMNLNTFARHEVFSDAKLTKLIAGRLQDEEQVKRAKVFPYQVYTAYQNVDSTVPAKVTTALQKSADFALSNIPEFEGQVYVMVDTSGSMKSPVTGQRGSVTTKTQCVDVAALVASAVLRKNPDTKVIPFDTSVHDVRLNPLDSIVTNAQTLAKFGGGGTNCSEALASVNRKNGKGDLVIYVSDNESWMDSSGYGRGTSMMVEWNKYKVRNPNAKLVCIDITPNATTQAHDRSDILNIGGFSDQVFDVISKFVELGNDKNLWVKTIESVDLGK